MIRSVFALALLLAACAVLAAPAPEPFKSGWGNPVDPDKDCKIIRDGDTLTIEMPGGDHDYDAPRERLNDKRAVFEFPGRERAEGSRERLNAPRLVREFEGDFEIQLRIRIDSRPSAESTVKGLPSFVAAGFLVTFPDTFPTLFHRFQYGVAGAGTRADGFATQLSRGDKGGSVRGMCDKNWGKWPFKAKPEHVYMRLERWGILLDCKISADRKEWVSIGGLNYIGLPSKLKVGIAAYSTSSDPSKVQFDQLTITHGKKRDPWEFVSGWSGPIDPDKDCKIKRDKDTLTIEMPGSDHDYDPLRKRFNAPRLLSELEGEFDLQVRVRIDYRPTAQSTVKGQPSFVAAGFLLIYPDGLRFPDGLDICNRLDFGRSQEGDKPEAYAVAPFLVQPRRKNPGPKEITAESYAAMKNWGPTMQRNRQWDHGTAKQRMNRMWERGWQDWPLDEKAEYAYLRLDHREGWSCFYISPDGEKWTQLDYLRSLPAKGKLALAAYSSSTEPSKVIFDQLKLGRGKKNEK